MRALSTAELQGLVYMAANPDFTLDRDAPILDDIKACVDRGVARGWHDDQWNYWEINDLGRLALRVHAAAALGQ